MTAEAQNQSSGSCSSKSRSKRESTGVVVVTASPCEHLYMVCERTVVHSYLESSQS